MVGRYKGFVSRIRAKQRDIIVTHCFLHRETLVVKTLPADLASTLNTVVKYCQFCQEKTSKKLHVFIFDQRKRNEAKLVVNDDW